MESSIQQEASELYDRLLQSRVLFKRLGQIEFATQPKEIVFRKNKLLLYHFQPKIKNPAATPLLIVFALINRPEILDFSADTSFIKGLLEAGRDVYLLDWGYPAAEDRHLSLSAYITEYLRDCVHQVKSKSRQKQIDLLGVCQGGVLSLCYAALFPREVRRLVLISTPVDFQTPEDVLGRLTRQVGATWPESPNNIAGASLAQVFAGLRPFQTRGKKYLALLDQLARDKPDPAWVKRFFLMEKWLLDTPDQAGRAFSEFIKIFYQQNSLVHGKFILDNYCIDLKSLTMPVLNVMARDDHIVPPRASRALRSCLTSAAYSARLLPAGHIGIYISQKTSRRLPKIIASWLEKMEADPKRKGEGNGRTTNRKAKGRRR